MQLVPQLISGTEMFNRKILIATEMACYSSVLLVKHHMFPLSLVKSATNIES